MDGKGREMEWRTLCLASLALLLFAGCGTKEPEAAYRNKDAQYQQKQAKEAIESLDRDFENKERK
jgi:outer membrane biogenesis lipoprotein LolB